MAGPKPRTSVQRLIDPDRLRPAGPAAVRRCGGGAGTRVVMPEVGFPPWVPLFEKVWVPVWTRLGPTKALWSVLERSGALHRALSEGVSHIFCQNVSHFLRKPQGLFKPLQPLQLQPFSSVAPSGLVKTPTRMVWTRRSVRVLRDLRRCHDQSWSMSQSWVATLFPNAAHASSLKICSRCNGRSIRRQVRPRCWQTVASRAVKS